jgi:hypothetical protein
VEGHGFSRAAKARDSIQASQGPTLSHPFQVVSQFECPSHTRTNAPANINQPKAKLIQLAILIFRCLSSIESPARDAGGFSETLKCRSFTVSAKKPIAPMKETITGKLMVMLYALSSVCQKHDFLKTPNVMLKPAAILGVILTVLWILAKL